MKKLIVFDWDKNEVHIYTVKAQEKFPTNYSTLLESFGHGEDSDYMVVDNDSKIINH